MLDEREHRVAAGSVSGIQSDPRRMCTVGKFRGHGANALAIVRTRRVEVDLGHIVDAREHHGRVVEVPAAVAAIHEPGRPLRDERPELVGHADLCSSPTSEPQAIDVAWPDRLLARGCCESRAAIQARQAAAVLANAALSSSPKPAGSRVSPCFTSQLRVKLGTMRPPMRVSSMAIAASARRTPKPWATRSRLAA